MLDQKRLDLLKGQSKTKPPIEDVVPDFLDGKTKDISLDFCAYLRVNHMKLVWAGTNAWKATYKNKVICYIRLATNDWYAAHKSMYSKHSWVITLYIESNMHKYEDVIMNEGLQNFIWNNVHYCMSCRTPCHGKVPPHRDTIALGKEIKGLCHGRQLTWVFDPDETAIRCIKRLLELEQKARDENAEAKRK